jgi:hypothetical protein
VELITILNRCHRFRGFLYQHAYFSADKKSIEAAVRRRKGSAAVCSRCHLQAPGYDQLAERRFQFIPLWGFLVLLLHTMRRVDFRWFSWDIGCNGRVRMRRPGSSSARLHKLTTAHELLEFEEFAEAFGLLAGDGDFGGFFVIHF